MEILKAFFENVKMYTGKYTEEFAVFKFTFQQFKNDFKCLQKYLFCVYSRVGRFLNFQI